MKEKADKDSRKEKLRHALRANLRKRKTQVRGLEKAETRQRAFSPKLGAENEEEQDGNE